MVGIGAAAGRQVQPRRQSWNFLTHTSSVSGWWARFCATGDPNGAYSYAGFDLFAGNPPADGGSLTAPMSSYSLALPGNHNYIGKMYAGGEIDNLNAAHPTLLSQAYAKHTYAGRMGTFLLACETNLEP